MYAFVHVADSLFILTESDRNVDEHSLDIVSSLTPQVLQCRIKRAFTVTVRCQEHGEPARPGPVDTSVQTLLSKATNVQIGVNTVPWKFKPKWRLPSGFEPPSFHTASLPASNPRGDSSLACLLATE